MIIYFILNCFNLVFRLIYYGIVAPRFNPNYDSILQLSLGACLLLRKFYKNSQNYLGISLNYFLNFKLI